MHLLHHPSLHKLAGTDVTAPMSLQPPKAQLLPATLLPTAHTQACICYTIARYAGWLGTNIIAASPRDPTTRVSESDRATASASAALLPQLMQLAVEALEVAEASGAVR
eukprot:scaffold174019_cov15-Tisochrysis_lutea.AAC.2